MPTARHEKQRQRQQQTQRRNAMSSTATTKSVTAIDSKKPATKQELIAANIKLLIEQLEAGHSEALTNYLTAMSRFHSYSFGNVLEIARQMPTATRVAGFWTWKNLGRSVKAGQKGIRILAPIVGVRRKKEEEAQKDITKQNERILLGFRNAYVFDVSQTDGVDLPEMREISGDPGENLERLAAFVRGRGIQLSYNENIAPALGISYGGRIALLQGQSKAEEFSTLVHETAHELLHKAERRTATTKTVRETEAEAVAFVVGKAVGLVTGSASADYVVFALM
jgi:N-terminal domain of anti-restriction factor ArdC